MRWIFLAPSRFQYSQRHGLVGDLISEAVALAISAEHETLKHVRGDEKLQGGVFAKALSSMHDNIIVGRVLVEGELTSEIVTALDREDGVDLIDYGIIPGRMLPLWREYGIPGDAAIIASGSWLYGLHDDNSDYDLRVVTEQTRYGMPDVVGGAAVTVFSRSSFAAALITGSRHAWEIATAPPECRSTPGPEWDEIDDLAAKARDRMDPLRFLSSSVNYIEKYAPALLGHSWHEADINIRRWKIRNGWAYKLGYYLLVDAILARYAAETGIFDPRLPFEAEPELRTIALQCKQGKMNFAEWMRVFGDVAHEKGLEALEKCLLISN